MEIKIEILLLLIEMSESSMLDNSSKDTKCPLFEYLINEGYSREDILKSFEEIKDLQNKRARKILNR